MARRSPRRSADGAIKVHGLDELSKQLRAMDKELVKELRKTNKSVADFVATDARAEALSIGGVAAHVAPSLKPAAGSDWAGIGLGGSGYDMAAGAEFGSVRFHQFKPWRGNGPDAGYFLYPAIRRDADRIESEYGKALDDLLQKNGLV